MSYTVYEVAADAAINTSATIITLGHICLLNAI